MMRVTERMQRLLRAPFGVPARRAGHVPKTPDQKASRANGLVAIHSLGEAVWSPRDYGAFAREGFMQNAIVYRCVRMIAEAAASIPLLLYRGTQEIESHPLLDLMRSPSYDHTGTDFLESWYGFLLVAGNAYVEAVAIGGEVRELHILRPDRMKVIPGPDGWPEGYEYSVNGYNVRFAGEVLPGVRPILHTRLFHPVDDHYGLSPIEAAATAIDIHNEASKWNKALLDNSARPSGALVYAAANGHMTAEQFERLKSELDASYQGALNAGRPMLLEGGLDWKPLSLSPKDMDFIAAKNNAAREIALALGVPPLLLGIPGDNTYANYAEAQRALWRQTVLPLVNRMARAFSFWLAPLSLSFAPSDSAARSRPEGAAGGGRLPAGESFGAIELRPDLDQVEALNPERDTLWARLEGVSFLTDDEKRVAAGYEPLSGEGTKKRRPFEFAPGDSPSSSRPPGAERRQPEGAKYSPDQPRVPAGHPDGGQWTDAGGGETSVELAQARGRGGNVRVGGYSFEATPAQILRLSNATNAAEAAVSRVRDIDPSWRPRPGLYESAEGAISHQIGIEAEANARFNELRRGAIPGTSHTWGVNRLRKELYDRGYRLEKQARSEGLIFRDVFGREVRIMNRPNQRYRNDSSQKFLNEHYYRYKPGPGKPWGQHTTILDKAGS